MKGLLKRYNGNEAYEQGKVNDNIDHRAVVYVKGETDKNRKLKMRYKHNYCKSIKAAKRGACIFTDYHPCPRTEFKVNVYMSDDHTGAFGAILGTQRYVMYLNGNQRDKCQLHFDGNNALYKDMAYNNQYEIWMTPDVYFFDKVAYYPTKTPDYTPLERDAVPLFLFVTNAEERSERYAAEDKWVYGFYENSVRKIEILEDGVTLFKYRPCFDNMENYGLLEMLSKTFYPSSRSDKSYCFVEGE